MPQPVPSARARRPDSSTRIFLSSHQASNVSVSQGCPHGGLRSDPLNLSGECPRRERMQATAELHVATRRFGEVTALEDLSLTVHAGEVVALVGPSGCGKSTLLELLAGLQQPDQGSVEAAPAAYMPQRDLLLPWRTALANA